MTDHMVDEVAKRIACQFKQDGWPRPITQVMSAEELDALTLSLEKYASALREHLGQHGQEVLSLQVEDLLECDQLERLLGKSRGYGLSDLARNELWIEPLVSNTLRGMFDRPSWKFSVLGMRLIVQTHKGPNSLGALLVEGLGTATLANTLSKMLEPWRLEGGSAISILLEDPGNRKDLVSMWQLLVEHPGNTNQHWMTLARVVEIIDKLPELEAAVDQASVDLSPLLAEVHVGNPAHAMVKRILLQKSVETVPRTTPTPRGRTL